MGSTEVGLAAHDWWGLEIVLEAWVGVDRLKAVYCIYTLTELQANLKPAACALYVPVQED